MGRPDPSLRFRDPDAVRRLADDIARLHPGRPVRVMHVCGTHENALCRYGLRDLLPPWLRLVAGPGCPVCVCPAADIDMAARLALDHGAVVATFGDVVRVPSRVSLQQARALGGDCRVVYGIDDAVALAAATPGRQVVFFAVGFETTACTTAAVVRRTLPANFSILCSHRSIPVALEALVDQDGTALDGFLLPGHVTAVAGLADYRALAARRRVPMSVAGFEPLDLLSALRALVARIAAGSAEVDNAYPRAVREEGNPAARAAMAEAFEEVDAAWRGIGVIPGTGLAIRAPYRDVDAAARFGIAPDPSLPDAEPGCLCGEVLLGRVEPEDCPLFGEGCHPDDPVGPCMVSFEGTCHARFRHGARRR